MSEIKIKTKSRKVSKALANLIKSLNLPDVQVSEDGKVTEVTGFTLVTHAKPLSK